ncbi:MAG: F0F1 ATP synthase subunit gamma [Defluviimonas sp.]|uniref:F0F1 ATP synthase subunit gamma n=1 Tax=Albidovulum sp. TaxID=1872424 RepID=UPI001D661745|nr:F0F1 ATP synthase subunit gamma [Paracoccaceae bacterium]MCC0062913.1 F0F1 ATP synthase subunit gamma [Defluviimonas sp.]
MTDRPEQVQRRMAGLDEIGQVVGALRAIAAAQASATRGMGGAIATYSATIASALGTIVAAAGPAPAPRGPGLLLVVGAAQGFSGAYPARIAEALRDLGDHGAGVVAVGRRTVAMLEDSGCALQWSADLPGHPAGVPALAGEIADRLIGLSAAFPGPIRALLGAPRAERGAELRRMFPPDPDGSDTAAALPLTTMPLTDLMTGLLQEALFAAVALALMQGMAAEAEARVEAMARAQTNLRARRTEVEQSYLRARQEQMTTEVIELTVARVRA